MTIVEGHEYIFFISHHFAYLSGPMIIVVR